MTGAVKHVFSNTIVDMTGTVTVGDGSGGTETRAATNLIRPSDWNSFHNHNLTLSGNTLGQSTASGTNIVLAAGANISLSVSQGAGAATVSVAGPNPLSSYMPIPAFGLSTLLTGVGTATSGSVSIWPFTICEAVSAGVVNIPMSASFVTVGTSSGRQTVGFGMALYARGTGANSTQMNSVVTASVSWQVTGNNSTYSINQVTATSFSGYAATAQTSSAGSNITSQYTGLKIIGFPVNKLLSPGAYWLGLLATKSTSSVNVGLSFSLHAANAVSLFQSMAPMGSLSSAQTSGADPFGRFVQGWGHWTSAGSVTMVPQSIAFASVTHSGAAVNAIPHMHFWST